MTNNLSPDPDTVWGPKAQFGVPGIAFEELASVGPVQIGTATRILQALHAKNKNAAVRYLQVFDSAGTTTTVLYQWEIPPQAASVPGQIIVGNDFFGLAGWVFATGLTVGISTTDGTYTAATAADHDFGGTSWGV